MCLAVPGKVLERFERGGMSMGRVQFGGVMRDVSLDCVPEAEIGDFVLVHVGFAISTVDPDEAERTYRLLKEMGQLDELDTPDTQELSDRKA